MPRIRITAGEVSMEAELNDSPTAKQVLEGLPLTGRANRWGEEIYFSIPVQADAGPDSRAEVEVGEIAYWPPGTAFCIFWGATPASSGDEPRAASPVNPLGKLDGDAGRFAEVASGTEVTIEVA